MVHPTLRIVFSVIAGFFSWAIAWLGIEKLLSAMWPEAYGIHQRAFESALLNGGEFTANSTMLLIHIVSGSLVSALAGFLAASIAGENKRSPLILGVVLLAMGLAKAAMSWPYVPIWYHVIFTAVLLPMAIVGGKMRRT